MAVPHITVDDILDQDRGRAAQARVPIRSGILAATALVGLLDWQVTGTEAAVLLWVPVVVAASLLGSRTEAILVASVPVLIGLATMLSGSLWSLAVEAAGRAAGLGAIAVTTAWAAGTARELSQRSRVDALTGLLNRAGFGAAMDRERQRALRSRTPISLVYLDLDGLKRANDHHGHEHGDQLLTRFAGHLDEVRRTVDVAARLGGDEFTLLLPDTDAHGTSLVLERLFRALRHDVGCAPVSAGAVTWTSPPPVDEMIRAADQAMYQVKREGGQAWIVLDLDALVTTQPVSSDAR